MQGGQGLLDFQQAQRVKDAFQCRQPHFVTDVRHAPDGEAPVCSEQPAGLRRLLKQQVNPCEVLLRHQGVGQFTTGGERGITGEYFPYAGELQHFQVFSIHS